MSRFGALPYLNDCSDSVRELGIGPLPRAMIICNAAVDWISRNARRGLAALRELRGLPSGESDVRARGEQSPTARPSTILSDRGGCESHLGALPVLRK